MQIIELESVPLVERSHVREGVFRSRRLLVGEPGSPGNFSLQLVSMPDTYYSPRHRHNFDQFRYQIEGEFDFATDGRMGPGSMAYFPEGTYYGPQSSTAASLTLVLQFGGASGSGYIAAEEYEQAAAILSASGSFEQGVYTRIRADGGKVNQDAYEAVWEQVNGRRLRYPPPRYGRPVFTQPDHFDWIALADQPGAACKLLGVFSERGTRAALYRIGAGASLALADHAIYFVLCGAGRVRGTGLSQYTTVHLQAGDRAFAVADEGTILLQWGLPRF